jgi:hypothetical protein
MNEEEHRVRHQELHRALDELLADYITHTGGVPSKTTVLELVEWAHQQTISPTIKPEISAEE